MGVFLCPVAVLLAATAPAKAPPETKSIDTICDAAAKLDDGHTLKPRLFGDLSEAISPEANDGSGKWREFKDAAALEAYAKENDTPNTQAHLWSAPDGTTIAGMYFQSGTGDWNDQVDYCFRPDGTLARADAALVNVSAAVSGHRVTYYGPGLRVLFTREKVFDDYHHHKRLANTRDLNDIIVYPTVKSLPFLAPPSAPKTKSPPDAGADAGSSLDKATVAASVREHLAAVTACYVAELPKHPGLSGRIIMRWTIDPSGQTRAISVEENTLPTPAVGVCLRPVIATWRFPKPTGGSVDVSFPFVFQASDEPIKRR